MTLSDAESYEEADSARAAGFAMDEGVFREFYDRNARPVWAYLARVTGDREAADDLLQEAFYRFLRAGVEHESEAHRRNSLYRIATNLARDARRRKVTRVGDSSGGESVEREAGAAAARLDVTRAMAQLGQRERAMLWLAYAEGASHREIAAVLGVAEGSMKLLLFRARRRLAGMLRGVAR